MTIGFWSSCCPWRLQYFEPVFASVHHGTRVGSVTARFFVGKRVPIDLLYLVPCCVITPSFSWLTQPFLVERIFLSSLVSHMGSIIPFIIKHFVNSKYISIHTYNVSIHYICNNMFIRWYVYICVCTYISHHTVQHKKFSLVWWRVECTRRSWNGEGLLLHFIYRKGNLNLPRNPGRITFLYVTFTVVQWRFPVDIFH